MFKKKPNFSNFMIHMICALISTVFVSWRCNFTWSPTMNVTFFHILLTGPQKCLDKIQFMQNMKNECFFATLFSNITEERVHKQTKKRKSIHSFQCLTLLCMEGGGVLKTQITFDALLDPLLLELNSDNFWQFLNIKWKNIQEYASPPIQYWKVMFF